MRAGSARKGRQPVHRGKASSTRTELGHVACALIDSAASECFVREKYLTPEILREKVEHIIYTACKTRTITVKTARMLPVTIGGVTEMVRFLVSDELRTDVTLGRTWLKNSKSSLKQFFYFQKKYCSLVIMTHHPSATCRKIFLKMYNTGSRENTRQGFSTFFGNTQIFSFVPSPADVLRHA